MRPRVLIALASAVCLAAFPGVTAYAKKKNADEARQFCSKFQKISGSSRRSTASHSARARAMPPR